MIFESRVPAYEAKTPERQWHLAPNLPSHVSGNEMVATMDKPDIDGATFISSLSMCCCDACCSVEVQQE
jgi:hypothetical protein